MNPQNHTAEPWTLKQHGVNDPEYGNGIIYSFGGADRFAQINDVGLLTSSAMDIQKHEANARRIAAAVNFCAGIPNDQLPPGGLAKLVSDMVSMAKLLRMVVSRLDECCPDAEGDISTDDRRLLAKARALFAKREGGAK